jgi:uncharacterized membrane protein YbhN (UPF0104 family)
VLFARLSAGRLGKDSGAMPVPEAHAPRRRTTPPRPLPAEPEVAAERRRPGASAIARVALAWAVGLGLLAWLVRDVGWQRLAASVRIAPWWAWAVTVLGLLGSYLLRALRIHAELSSRHRLTVAQCLEVMVLHNAAVNLLPMRGGEAAYPWLVNRRFGVSLAHGTASLVWMRVQDALVLALLALAVWPGIPTAPRALAAAGLVFAVAGGLRALQRVPPTRAGGARVLRAVHGAVQALSLAPRHGWAGWAYCGSSWTLKLLVLGGLLAKLSGISGMAPTTGALGGELSGVLPLQGPANFGTYETGVWVGVSLRGPAPRELVAAAVAVHLVSLATAVASGLAAYAISQRRHGAPSAAEARRP